MIICRGIDNDWEDETPTEHFKTAAWSSSGMSDFFNKNWFPAEIGFIHTRAVYTVLDIIYTCVRRSIYKNLCTRLPILFQFYSNPRPSYILSQAIQLSTAVEEWIIESLLLTFPNILERPLTREESHSDSIDTSIVTFIISAGVQNVTCICNKR